MSFKKAEIFPANPITARGVSTKLSSSKDRVIYTNGKSVIVRTTRQMPNISHPKLTQQIYL